MRNSVVLLTAFALLGVVAPPATARSHSPAYAARLAARARRHDRLARATLVDEHMGLVRAVASRYQGLGLPMEDLVQEGAIGLLSAVDNYEAGRGAAFSTFAYWRIRSAITHALTTKGNVVRLPRTARARGQRVVSVPFDESVADTSQPRDRLLDDRSSRPDAQALRQLEAHEIRAAVRRLGSRERSIISRHFGLGRESQTLAEIAADLHLSPTRTQTLKDRALATLAAELAGAALKSSTP